jgi:hypothetical protein
MNAKQRAARWTEVRQAVLASPDALTFLAEILCMAPPLTTAFAGEQTHTTAFQCGQQNVTRRIVAELQAIAPDALARLTAATLPRATTPDHDA